MKTSTTSFMQPDVTLNLDVSGIIQRAVLANAIADEPVAELVGKAWVDTVGAVDDADRPIQRMIDDATAAGVSGFHWVNQRFPSGLELPIEYTTVRLGGSAGLIAIGRSLEAVEGLRAGLVAAHATMERDTWKMRGLETRRRMLFNAAIQPSLMIGANDLLVREANPAAADVLGLSVGAALLPSAEEREAFLAMLDAVSTKGTAPAIILHLGAELTPWLVRGSLAPEVRGAADAPTPCILLRLSPAASTASTAASTSAPTSPTSEAGARRREDTSQVQLTERSRAAARELIREKVAMIEAQVAEAVSELTRNKKT